MPQKVLFILGTRPEAVKLCPVILHMQARPQEFRVRTCVTAQHRGLLDQVLTVFGVRPDHDLNVMQPGQKLLESTGRILSALEPVMAEERPHWVVVQGDTTTTFCGALAGFYHRVPVAHVEAGLRTGDLDHPFPEEANRVLTGRLASWHFAPTAGAAANLLREGVREERIAITGNTGIDALFWVRDGLAAGRLPRTAWPWPAGSRLIVATTHRRENFGSGMEQICESLRRLAERPDVRIVLPVHPNPQVRQPVEQRLGGMERVHLIDPLEYVSFIDLMNQAEFLLTDSGGVQEEAPSLGKPVLVMRDKTERPEAVEAGTAVLVGTDPDRILREASRLLDDRAEYAARTRAHNPYGDGQASQRIARILASGC